MSEDKEVKVIEENKEFANNGTDWIWGLLILSIFGFGWNSPENPKINELEKKVARLEGQMPMIGGKNL